MCCAFSRAIKSGDVIEMPGIRSGIALGSCVLAHHDHAPDLTVYTVHGEADISRLQLRETTSDWRSAADRFRSCELFDIFDLIYAGRIDWTFAGAMQVDMHGNLNLVCVGDHDRPRLRGPGTAGISSENYARHFMVWVTEHTRRVFVPDVDYISALGFGPVRETLHGHIGGGIGLLLTPLCAMAPAEDGSTFRVVSRHPGVTVDQIVERTGFPLEIDSDTPETPAVTARERDLLRRVVDPGGVLRNERIAG
jgi:glutaconate CoA-transferase subunit B